MRIYEYLRLIRDFYSDEAHNPNSFTLVQAHQHTDGLMVSIVE
jgi:hypothetical protein